MARPLGALLILLRESRGLAQKDVADRLCELSGQTTVTRHEVSRWEREERMPSDFWLGWLSKVLEVPVTDLERARVKSKGTEATVSEPGVEQMPEPVNGTKWRNYARSIRERSLALVSLRFEHRATSVQLSGTYEQPEQATAAIGMFEQMVTPGADARTTGRPEAEPETTVNSSPTRTSGPTADDRSTRNGVPAEATFAPQHRGAEPYAAGANGNKPARVPMGIRYTKGPGTPNGTPSAGAGRPPARTGGEQTD